MRWHAKPRPILSVVHLCGDSYVLTDSRYNAESPDIHILDRQQASVVLTGASLEQREQVAWALDQQWLFELDGRLIPLATAPPDLLLAFEGRIEQKRGNSIAYSDVGKGAASRFDLVVTVCRVLLQQEKGREPR